MSRLLTLQDDSGGFDFVGNAFQVKDKDARKLAYIIRILLWTTAWIMCQDMQNIDDLKKVLTSNRISFILWEHFSEEKWHM